MRKLAESVGCSHGNLYLHFKDKEALFDCLVEESFEQFGEGLRKVPESARRGDPVEFLRKAGRAYVEWGVANASVYEFVFILRRPEQKRPRKPHVTYERMRNLVQRCIDESGSVAWTSMPRAKRCGQPPTASRHSSYFVLSFPGPTVTSWSVRSSTPPWTVCWPELGFEPAVDQRTITTARRSHCSPIRTPRKYTPGRTRSPVVVAPSQRSSRLPGSERSGHQRSDRPPPRRRKRARRPGLRLAAQGRGKSLRGRDSDAARSGGVPEVPAAPPRQELTT